ncbi:MAG: hypothetical protein U0165_13595 [Polyangiaceae bacterium]
MIERSRTAHPKGARMQSLERRSGMSSANDWRVIDLHDELSAVDGMSVGRRFATGLAFNPTAEHLAMAAGNRILVHDAATGARLEEYVAAQGLEAQISVEMAADVSVSRIAFTADGRMLVAVDMFRDDLCIQHSMIEVFERKTGALRCRISEPVELESQLERAQAMYGSGWLRSGVSAWSLSPNGTHLAVARYDGSLEIVDTLSGSTLHALAPHSGRDARELVHPEYRRAIRGMAFDPKGSTLTIARWLAIGHHGALDIEVLDAHSLERVSSFRFFRELLVSDVERVFGPSVKMASTGRIVRMSPEDCSSNLITDVLPERGRMYRSLSLSEYRVVDISADCELILCWLAHRPFHTGQPWYRLARVSQGIWEALEVPTLSSLTPDQTQEDLKALVEEALSNEPFSPVMFSGGTISRRAERMAMASDAAVLVGPCRRARMRWAK